MINFDDARGEARSDLVSLAIVVRTCCDRDVSEIMAGSDATRIIERKVAQPAGEPTLDAVTILTGILAALFASSSIKL